jgi:hypothetical protein
MILMILGAGFVLYLDRYQLTKEQTGDIENKQFKKDYQKSLQNQ